jgi:hypothetical protein
MYGSSKVIAYDRSRKPPLEPYLPSRRFRIPSILPSIPHFNFFVFFLDWLAPSSQLASILAKKSVGFTLAFKQTAEPPAGRGIRKNGLLN